MFKDIKISFVVVLFFFGTINCYAGEAFGNKKTFVGQWIWSSKDQETFLEAQKQIPDIVPGIWVSTIKVERGIITQRLAMSPEVAKKYPAAVFIVRIDDSLHAVWKKESADIIAFKIDSCLNTLMRLLADARIKTAEVQLDYDCPVRSLDVWARVVRIVSESSLKGKRLWITSLPAHIDNPEYSLLFQAVATGHILQLFDTGIQASQKNIYMLSSKLRRQKIPFRLGLGSFERAGRHESTNHRAWFSALSSFEQIPGYQGVWIFPGGRKWLNLYPSSAN